MQKNVNLPFFLSQPPSAKLTSMSLILNLLHYFIKQIWKTNTHKSHRIKNLFCAQGLLLSFYENQKKPALSCIENKFICLKGMPMEDSTLM